jgi:hypothetical protein
MLHRPRGVHYGRHQKTYLSREMTRAMALEHPIGDPHGGVAFGERNEPISAILSIGTLFSTGGAVLAGTATLMQGLMFAGSALSLVGNLTGNSKLSKIGMFVGLAGGVGALAESAGMFSSGTLGETFGYGSGAATGAPGAALQGTPTATPDVQVSPIEMPNPIQGTDLPGIDAGPLSASANPIAPEGGFNVNDALSGSAAPGGAAPVVAPAGAATPLNAFPIEVKQTMDAGFMPGNAGPAPVDAAAPGPVNATAAGPTPAAATAAGPTPAASVNPTDARLAAGTQQTPSALSGWDKIKSMGSGVMDFAKSNPGAAYAMSGAISGAMDWVSGKTKAQIDAMEANGELSRAQADQIRYRIAQEERRRQQMNDNYKNVRTNIQVDPNTFQVSTPGLVSGAMQPPPRG